MKDSNLYGLNEEALGFFMRNFLRPENAQTCPHAMDAFVDFAHALRADRETLVLKTPSNIRFANKLREYLPNSRFIAMIREPHASVVSGISRHGDGYSIEDVARIWQEDNGQLDQLTDNDIVVSFEELVADPTAALQRVSAFLPLEPEVFKYATRVNRPERSAPEWWRSKIDEATQREVEKWVAEFDLVEMYRSAIALGEGEVGTSRASPAPVLATSGPWVRLKKEFFRAWYRINRSR